jgi:uncharacterized membrane protein YccC
VLSALRRARRRLSDFELASLKSAARAAIVMPAVFAFADKVIADPQTSTFAAFGSIAMLVLVQLTGAPKARFAAYVALALVGATFVVLGTLCSRNAWLAAGAMLVVGFVVLYLGVLGGYFAAAGTAAILAFVLPVTIPVPLSSIPARLEGWGLASGAAICAVMLMWPARPRGTLGPQAARACTALADLGDSRLAGDRATIEARASVAREAVESLRRGFLGVPHRPTGPTGPTAALAALVDELDWLQSFLIPAAEGTSLELCREENAEALAASVAVLRASAARLEGQSERPDLEELDAAREAVAQALVRSISEVPRDQDLQSAVETSFRISALSYSVREVATYALLATGAEVPELDEQDIARRPRAARSAREALQATTQLAVEHASAQSVWFRNSIRGAVGLAVAVFIAQRTGLQHSFWVVLGTLSVLRSNALATGSSIVSALAGTAVGILVGAVLVIAIGTHETVLWAVLPVAVLFAAYAPRAISFAAGQAAFTVVLFVLFNLIQPTGWEVGVVRIEDVAIGFAISLGVGLLFWPRGAASLLRENLASAYARSADYVVAMTRQLIDRDASSDGTEQRSTMAVHQLEDVFRQYLADRSATNVAVEDVATLVAGAARVRRAAQSLSALGSMADGGDGLGGCGENLDGEVNTLRAWYVTLGESLLNASPVPPPHVRDAEGRRRLFECVRDAVAGGDDAKRRPALVLVWASQYLDDLWSLEAYLGRHAVEASRRPSRFLSRIS